MPHQIHTWPNIGDVPEGAFFGEEYAELYTHNLPEDAIQEVVEKRWDDELPSKIIINVMVPDEIKIDAESDILEGLWEMMHERYCHPELDAPTDFDPEVVECAERLASAIKETYPVTILRVHAQIVVDDPALWVSENMPESPSD